MEISILFFLIEKEIFNLKYIIYSLPYIDLRFCNPTIRNSKRDDAKQIPRILPIHRDTFLFPFPPDVEAATRVSVTGSSHPTEVTSADLAGRHREHHLQTQEASDTGE